MFGISVLLWALAAAVLMLLWRSRRRANVKFKSIDALPGPKSPSFFKGHLSQLFAIDAWPFFDPVVKLNIILGGRMLWVFDPKALHQIMLKDQDIYEEGHLVSIFNRLLFGPGLFGTVGEQHRLQRKLLNPVFSIAHMRHLAPLFWETAHRLREGIKLQLQTSETNEVDILMWMGRATLELIGQGGFGRSFDPLVKGEPDAYAEAVKEFVPTGARVLAWQFLIPLYVPFLILADKYPAVRRVLRHVVPFMPHPGMREMQKLADTCCRTSQEIYAEKLRALMSGDEETKIGVEEGKDLLSVLLRANMEAAEEDRLPEEEIIGQITSFTFAGTDTTSNALGRILHLLCMHPDVQERLRSEIVEARRANGGQNLDYDDLVKLPYLDAVCRETLRLYPLFSVLRRRTKADSVLPLSTPISGVDGSTITSVHVPEGTMVIVSIYSCNRNKAIWGEDAAEWKPERWLGGGVPESVVEARIPGVYANLLTFSGGGRSCIGFKFAELGMKVVLSKLLASFRFSLADGENGDIIWNRGTVTYPSTRTNTDKPTLPMKVEVI